jgi:hypothetical protein
VTFVEPDPEAVLAAFVHDSKLEVRPFALVVVRPEVAAECSASESGH